MRVIALLVVATSLAAQDPVDLRGWINQGVQEFNAARYPEAVAAFERAAAIDPSNVTAQIYLGTAYMQQFIPGVESAENLRIAETAQAHFLRALNLEPSNKVALASMASLLLNQKKWDDAQQWYEKITASDPTNADAWYSMGFVAWSRWYPAYAKARASLGMRPEEPGPIKDGGVRADLTARYGAVLEGGLRALEKALEIDPQYDDAMAYMNLLIRERADLRDTAEEYKRDVAIADDWVMKALATKKAKAEQRNANVMASPATPPPPSSPPSRIVIAGKVAEAQRLRGVAPVYRVSNVSVISGHPLLIPAALDAVKQWEFKPTLLNGEPVEVATVASVPFVL